MILLAITPGLGFDRVSWRTVLHAGVDEFMIREKDMSARHLLEAARWCQDTAPEVRLWMAGRLDVAFAAGCGLHAPEVHPDLEPGLVPLSRPLHDESQWMARRTSDQLLISPIFATPGKGAPWGWERCRTFLDGLPAIGPKLLALGGVDPFNAPLIMHPRLAGIAAIRPFWGGDPARTVARFRE
jgi:thiamine monophosphate synthase